MIWGLNLYHAHKSQVRESLLCQCLYRVGWASPTSGLVTHQGEPLPARGNMALQAEGTDAIAAWGPRSLRRTGLKRGQREKQEDFRRRKGAKGKRKCWEEKDKGEGKELAEWEYWGPPGTGRQTYQVWWRWNKRFSWSLATHEEVAFGGPRSAQILSPEEDKCPMLGATKYLTDQGSWPP